MYFLLLALVAVVSVLLPCADSLAQGIGDPPLASIVAEDFSPMQEQWQPASGAWVTSGGTYGVGAAGPQAISTITSYRGVSPDQPPSMQLQQSDYVLRARVRNAGTTDDQLVGIVYGYQDSQNYYEVVLSAIGTVTMRRVQNGVAVNEVPAIHPHIPRNTWTELAVRWNHGITTLRVDGRTTFLGVQQPEFTSGQVGLVSHNANGRFDKVSVGVPIGDQPFLELFDDDQSSVTFEPKSGQWALTGGTYNNSAVQATNILLAPVHHLGLNPGQTSEYTFRTDMLNPYAGAGNLVGIVFNYSGSSYHEVVFSPTGVAKVNRFENGRLTTIATASYNARRNIAFNVQLELGPNRNGVIVDGVRIFDNFDNPQQIVEGGVGLITHWAPGRFDNIQFDQGIFQPCSFTFGNPPQPRWIVSGTWDTAGGTLNNTSAGSSDIVNFQCIGNDMGADSGTDYIVRARLLNPFAGAGNLVGLIFNYQGPGSFYAGDYFEVVFSPTGVLQLNKFIQGVRYNIASATHNVPRNTFFDVEVRRDASQTRVQVNGTELIQFALSGELQGGSIGVISHFAKGKFDNVALINNVPRPPSEL